MKNKLIGLLLVFAMLFCVTAPAFVFAGAAAAPAAFASSGEEQDPAAQTGDRAKDCSLTAFFRTLFDRIKRFFDRIPMWFRVRKEGVKNTSMQNAIHMLRSVTDTIGDSFIITTRDGKVIVIDGGHRTETPYFLEYLKRATGMQKPHIDAWFLSHPHDDHCEVFLEVAEHYRDEVSFDRVYANFPDASFYEGYDEWAVTVIGEYRRLLPTFADRAAALAEGDVFNVGDAKFTVFYTFNPAWRNCNEASTIMRMDLGGTSVMFNGDAAENAGNYVVETYGGSGVLNCDYCKMAHHGQDGVGRNFYEAVSPSVCLWPTPTWVYENTNGNLKTFETRAWVRELGVEREYKSFEGSQVIWIGK